MADKMFMTMEEVSARLGKTEDQVRDLVKDGQLREFRSGGKLMFRTEDVEKLAGELGISPAPSGGGGNQADTNEESAISLADSYTSDTPADVSADANAASDSLGEIELAPLDDSVGSDDDSAEVLTLDDADDASDSGDKKEDTVITSAGVSIFDEDELGDLDTDPMAKTQIAPSVGDQISLEGAGSGSGLLDLTRESDDTSLGADVLDNISSDDEEGDDDGADQGQADAPGVEEADMAVAAAPAAAVRTYQVGDPTAGVFSVLLVIALVVLGFCGASLAAGVLSTVPGFVAFVSNYIPFFAGGLALVSALIAVVGVVLARR